MDETKIALYKLNPIAAPVFPLTKRYSATGTQMNHGPTIGNMDAKIANAVSNRACGTPKINNPKPVAIP